MEFKINGESMLPLLRSDSQVKLQAMDISEIHVGDIIAYYDKNARSMVVHRVIKKTKQGLILKGDNNWQNDNIKVKEAKTLAVRSIRTNGKNIDMRTNLARFLNTSLLILSVLRLIPLINRRQFLKKRKINGQEVSKKVYKEHMKLMQ